MTFATPPPNWWILFQNLNEDGLRLGGLAVAGAERHESAYVQVSRTPGTTQEVGHVVAGVREAPRHEIAGGFPGLWGFDRGGDDGGARVARLW